MSQPCVLLSQNCLHCDGDGGGGEGGGGAGGGGAGGGGVGGGEGDSDGGGGEDSGSSPVREARVESIQIAGGV